jgi:hypothetical protein
MFFEDAEAIRLSRSIWSAQLLAFLILQRADAE